MSSTEPDARKEVRFDLRTYAEMPIQELAQRLSAALGCEFREYHGKHFTKKPAFDATVLGIWVTLAEVLSEEPDAPRRYQLSGRPPEAEHGPWGEKIELHSFILQVLEDAGLQNWYRPNQRELLLDAGLGSYFANASDTAQGEKE